VFTLNAVLALLVGGLAHAYEGMRWRLADSLREVEEVRLVEAQLQEQAAKAELPRSRRASILILLQYA